MEDDSSDYSSSSDDIYEKSSDEYEEPLVPQRPPILRNRKEIPENSNDGKKDDSGDSAQTSQQLPTLNSGNADSSAQKCVVISEKSDCTSTQTDQSPVKVLSVEENSRNIEPGNTLNNFLEICTKRLPDDDDLPPEINDDAMVTSGFQDTSAKSCLGDSSEKETCSLKSGDMGDTKYKEITEEPEELGTKSANTEGGKTDCSTAGSKIAAVIPGLQEIQEGLIKDADDVASDQTDADVPVKNVEENVEETPAGDVEMLRTEGLIDNSTNPQDGSAECGNKASEISVGNENGNSTQEAGKSSPDDLLKKETEDTKEPEQEPAPAVTNHSAETENQSDKK